jgi:predicted RNA-binding protein YlxR (DUF448 family)
VIDAVGSMPGRGAYLCRGSSTPAPAADCLQQALRRGGIARALRGAVKLDLGASPAEDPEFVESVN